jgi:hypothetical protein
MFSQDMCRMYRRLLALGLLSACLIVFSFSANVESVYAAPCFEDCEDNLASCMDNNCPDDCSTTDENCNSCIQACNAEYANCLGDAVFCNIGYSYSPRCQVGYADHCPIINGNVDCNHPSAHSGFYQICTRSYGQCIACPGNERCEGSNGLLSCFP